MLSQFNNRYLHYQYFESEKTLLQQWHYTGQKNQLHLLRYFNEIIDLQQIYNIKHLVLDFQRFTCHLPISAQRRLKKDFVVRLAEIGIASITIVKSQNAETQTHLEQIFSGNLPVPIKFLNSPNVKGIFDEVMVGA